MKNVLDVGQCAFDHGVIRALVEKKFDAHVTQAHDAEEALAALRSGRFDLVLVNRKLDADGSDGLAIVERIKAEPPLAELRVMMVSNYSDVQQQAVAAGAELGFGKSDLHEPKTLERLRKFLG